MIYTHYLCTTNKHKESMQGSIRRARTHAHTEQTTDLQICNLDTRKVEVNKIDD